MRLKQRILSIVLSGTENVVDKDLHAGIVRNNYMALLIGSLAFFFGTFYFIISGEGGILAGVLVESACFAGVILLNKVRRYHIAALLAQVTFILSAIYFGCLLGMAIEASLLAIFTIGISFLLLKNNRSRAFAFSATLLSLVVMELNKHYAFISPIIFPPHISLIIHYCTVIVIVLIISFTIMLYVLQNDRLLQQLQDTGLALERRGRDLQLTNAALEKANLTKTVFLRETSHEIRNPLHAIFGISQLLMMEIDKHEQYKNLAPLIVHLHSASYNVTQIINNILELSRIEAGAMDDLRKDPIMVKEWIDNIIQIYQYVADLRSVKLRLEVNPAMADRITSDKIKLTQVVNNLLMNAIKFTESDTIVTIHLFREKEHWFIAVSDQGRGITEDRMEHIFNPFVIEQGGTIDGSGLGLPIAKRLTELLQGQLTVINNASGGTTFTASFPFEGTTAEVPQAAPGTTDFHGKTILVAEDNMMNQLVFSNFLSRSGCRLVMADNGRQALEKARQQIPDLILLDMQMPVMNGREALLELKKDPALQHIPVVIVSGDALRDAIDEILQAGADDYLLKPVQYKSLYTILGKHLRQTTVTTS